MNFLFALVILMAAVSAVLVPVFFGHGLAEVLSEDGSGRGTRAMLLSLVFLAIAAVLFFVVGRLRRPAAGGHHEVAGSGH